MLLKMKKLVYTNTNKEALMKTGIKKARSDFLESWGIFKETGEINDAREFLRCLDEYDRLRDYEQERG